MRHAQGGVEVTRGLQITGDIGRGTLKRYDTDDSMVGIIRPCRVGS